VLGHRGRRLLSPDYQFIRNQLPRLIVIAIDRLEKTAGASGIFPQFSEKERKRENFAGFAGCKNASAFSLVLL